MDNLRLFVGISLTVDVREAMAEIMERMAASLPFKKWTHPADLHVTLHFLGDTPAGRLKGIREAMAATAADSQPFRLALTSPGTFGLPQAPRILWCGLTEPGGTGSLAACQAALAPRLARAGCTIEDRPFRAHVTMARQGGAGCRREDIDSAWRAALKAEGIPTEIPGESRLAWSADRITLFLSRLGRRPSYEQIHEVPFL